MSKTKGHASGKAGEAKRKSSQAKAAKAGAKPKARTREMKAEGGLNYKTR